MSRSHRCLAACNINFDVLCSRLGPAAAAWAGMSVLICFLGSSATTRSSLLHLVATLLAQSKVARHLGIIEHVNV